MCVRERGRIKGGGFPARKWEEMYEVERVRDGQTGRRRVGARPRAAKNSGDVFRGVRAALSLSLSHCSPPRRVFFAAGTSSCVAFAAHRTTLLRERYAGVKNRGKSITERRGAPVATTETAWHCPPSGPSAPLFRFSRSSLADRLSLSSPGCLYIYTVVSLASSICVPLFIHPRFPSSVLVQPSFPFAASSSLAGSLHARSLPGCFFLRLASGVVLF